MRIFGVRIDEVRSEVEAQQLGTYETAFFALSVRTIARTGCQSLPLVGFVTLAPNGLQLYAGRDFNQLTFYEGLNFKFTTSLSYEA